MNDNIDKGEIRKAIDRLQAEHPCGIAYDPTAFVNMEAVNTIKECVDKIARRMMEDTEINIICEFAKLYLEDARPMVMPKREWIPCDEQLPEKHGYYLVQTDGSHNDVIDIAEFGKLWSKRCEDFVWEWNKASRVIAWMPLPEPYEKEEIPKTYSTKLTPVGFSQHDCESHYECPFCGEHYGSWSIPIGKPFKCKCGKYVWTD